MDTVLRELQAAVSGRVVGPDDPDFDRLRRVVYGGFDRRPAAIVRPAGVDDVCAAVGVARAGGVPLVVRGGGHSVAGYSASEGGIVLDTRDLRSLRIDPERRVAVAEPGLTAREFVVAAGEHGLATGFGDYGGVGVAGITLGGGVGFLARKLGLTIDSLLAVEVVTAAGEVLTVDESHHPDLFWALRGGGGNFGVVTRLTFRLHPVATTVSGLLMLPATADVIEGLVASADAAPDELTMIANVMRAMPMPGVPPEHVGQPAVLALICFAGPPDEADKALAPFRALAEPLVDALAPHPYAAIYDAEPPADDDHQTFAASRNMFVSGIDHAAAAAIVERVSDPAMAMGVAQLRPLGGAVSRVPDDATAYAHRSRRVMVNLAAICESMEQVRQAEPWVADFARAIDTGDDGAYVNFVADSSDAGVRSAYPPATWARLRRVKAAYDPDNLFRGNANIPPAPA